MDEDYAQSLTQGDVSDDGLGRELQQREVTSTYSGNIFCWAWGTVWTAFFRDASQVFQGMFQREGTLAGAHSGRGQRPLGEVAFNLRSEATPGVGWVKGAGKSVCGRGNSMCKGPKVRNKKLSYAAGSQSKADHGVSWPWGTGWVTPHRTLWAQVTPCILSWGQQAAEEGGILTRVMARPHLGLEHSGLGRGLSCKFPHARNSAGARVMSVW